ncbi:MAG: hypothetical protein WC650_04055 [Candidatus Doudnabacteria bacterium]
MKGEELFDKDGRRITKDLKSAISDANRNYHLVQPQMTSEEDYANRFIRLEGLIDITVGQFKNESEHLLNIIQSDPQISNIVNGIHLPVIVSQMSVNNLGNTLEWYLDSAGESYKKTFKNREFHNYRKGTLTNAVSIVPESRHDRLIEVMKSKTVVGIYFPNPLQGFSICADREQMVTLPEGFILSGLDVVIGMIMYPDVLARDWYTLGFDLAAFSWQSVDSSLCFKAHVDRLNFVNTGLLGYALDSFSGGLLFLG